MPRRTNDFQELVALIERAFAPDGAQLIESAMVDSSNGMIAREVDVLVDSIVGEYRIRAVEAKDESRPMDMTRFEAILGKYFVNGGVEVDKLVVVTRCGFSSSVVERAALVKVELVTLSEVESVDLSRLRPVQPCLQSLVEIGDVSFDEQVSEFFGGQIPSNASVVCSCGRTHQTIKDFAKYVFWQKVVIDNRDDLIVLDEQAIADQKSQRLNISFGPAPPHKASLCLDGRSVEIAEFRYDVHLNPNPECKFSPQVRMIVAPHVCRVDFLPATKNKLPGNLLDKATVKCSCCDRELGTVRRWATSKAITSFLNSNKPAQKLLSDGLHKSPDGNAYLIGEWGFCSKLRVVCDGTEFAPKSVKITIHAVRSSGSLTHRQLDVCSSGGNSTIIDALDGLIGNKRMRVIMPDGIASKKLLVRIDDVKSTKHGRSLVRRRRKLDQRKRKSDKS